MLRAMQVSTWPGKYKIIWRDSSIPLSSRRAQYVRYVLLPSNIALSDGRRDLRRRLFSTLWLIANDISVGHSLSLFLRSSSSSLSSHLVSALHVYAVDLPIKLLRWTNSYPVGLKLNDELGRAFCEGSVRAIEVWWQRTSRLFVN